MFRPRRAESGICKTNAIRRTGVESQRDSTRHARGNAGSRDNHLAATCPTQAVVGGPFDASGKSQSAPADSFAEYRPTRRVPRRGKTEISESTGRGFRVPSVGFYLNS